MNVRAQNQDKSATTMCRAWRLVRADGHALGFTDHDGVLEFDGTIFRPDGGMSSSALEQSTGLSVDNAEAFGVLSSNKISSEDIAAGLYDAAAFSLWQVNWQDLSERELLFRGQLGDIRQSGAIFQAELRGLSDLLAQPRGRTFQKGCGAVLGDRACGVHLNQPLYQLNGTVQKVIDKRVLWVETEAAHDAGWFARGTFQFETGLGQVVEGAVKSDGVTDGCRRIELWHPLALEPALGTQVTVNAGCDKLFSTCRFKFRNTPNFQGFPDLPGDDWMMRYPNMSEPKDGGSRR